MQEELQRRNYSSETIRAYLFAVKDFATYFGKRPDLLRQELASVRVHPLEMLRRPRSKQATLAKSYELPSLEIV
jgi:hypothetical protein